MAEEHTCGTIKKPFALTFRDATLHKLDGGQFRVRFRRDGAPRQLREIARRLTGAPFITVLDSTGKHFKEFDYPIEDTGSIECTIVVQQPVITANALAALLWCKGNPMLKAMGNPMKGGDLIALGLRRLPPVRKVVAGAGYFVICLADYSIRVIGDAPATHLEPRWKFSDLLAAYEIPGATAFLWGDTYLQFWNRDKRKRLDGFTLFKEKMIPLFQSKVENFVERNLGNPNTFFARVHLFELPSCCFVFTVMCLEFLWKLCLSSKQTHKPVKCLKSSVVNDMFQTNSLKSLCRLPPQDTGWVEWVCNFTFGDLLVLAWGYAWLLREDS